MFIIITACCSWPGTRYVILLFLFNIVYYGYLTNFRGFCRFLIHGNSSYVVLYTQCLRYNICSAWFLDIRISTCLIHKMVAKFIDDNSNAM